MLYLSTIIGVSIGFGLSLILLINQTKDWSFYLLSAPYYIEEYISNTGSISTIVVIVYFTFVFGLLGFIVGRKWNLTGKIFSIVTVVVIHLLISVLGWRYLFSGFNRLKDIPISIKNR
jgi:hypothetical protein